MTDRGEPGPVVAARGAAGRDENVPDGASPPDTGDPSRPAASDWPSVRRWRKEMRATLIARRLAVPRAERAGRDAMITTRLEQVLESRAMRRVGIYWPFKGEFDPRMLARRLHARGIALALPVVVAKATPLVFRPWAPGTRLVPGVWNILVPAEGEPVTPDVVLSPVVGFDAGRYRLGYGGGYYDRTLAAMAPRPFVIGVGFALSRLPSIHPQPHDIPMDLIVTEEGTGR
jgi:5-formyltetrahydrofolate cyclo-ligase